MTGGVSVALVGVGRRFATAAGPVDALVDVDLEIPAGCSVAITGPSGCGKSTLLSVIGALQRPTRGRIEIAGRAVSDMTEQQRVAVRRELVGFGFQSDNLQPFLTAVENVGLQLALSGVTDADRRPRELLATLGLGAAAGRFPDELSGGERQRVAVARAIVHRPRLILADEPTGALDPRNSRAVVDLLRDVQAEIGATLIVSTHDPAVAKRCDRRVGLLDGRVVTDTDAVRRRTADPTRA